MGSIIRRNQDNNKESKSIDLIRLTLLLLDFTKDGALNGFTIRNIMCYSSSHAVKQAFASLVFNGPFLINPFLINQDVEPEKLIAERLNEWEAMLGFFAAVGSYLTTGQIIPGFV